MDELVYLNLLEELENAEDNYVNDNAPAERNVLDPLRELNNNQFCKMFRLTKDLFEYLVVILTPYMTAPQRQTDLTIPIKVLAALRFFASGSYQLDVGSNWFIGLSQSSISRSIREVADALNRPEIFNAWVKFPENFDELNVCRLRFYKEYNIPGVIGCIDCTHVAIFPPTINDENYPEHVYVNRKGYHSLNVQLICDADLKIINVNARYPGSTNDSFIWNNSNVQNLLHNLHEQGHNEYFLPGDSGYPLRTWLMTPQDQEPIPNTPEYRYNVSHKTTRSIIERCNGILKTRFRCLLKHRVLHYAPEVACRIITSCVVLHNLCREFNVPAPDWDDEDILLNEADFG